MTATGVTGWGPARPGRLARSLRGAGLSSAALAGAGAAGALVSVRAAYPRPPRAAPPEGWPPPGPVPRGRLTVAVVLGASGSVITDALGPYEVFARSPEFFAYTVSGVPQIFRTGDPIGFSPERTGSSAGETEALHSGVQGAGRQESGRLLAAANDRRGGAGTQYQRYHARVLG